MANLFTSGSLNPTDPYVVLRAGAQDSLNIDCFVA